MYFELSVRIHRPPADVFAFLRDKDRYPQEPDSPVLALDKTTPGSPRVGTQYREIVRMLPLVTGEILSEVTRYDPPRFLEEDFCGAGMRGHLAYECSLDGEDTVLVQRETLELVGLLRMISPLIRMMLSRRLAERLDDIRSVLESGWKAGSSS